MFGLYVPDFMVLKVYQDGLLILCRKKIERNIFNSLVGVSFFFPILLMTRRLLDLKSRTVGVLCKTNVWVSQQFGIQRRGVRSTLLAEFLWTLRYSKTHSCLLKAKTMFFFLDKNEGSMKSGLFLSQKLSVFQRKRIKSLFLNTFPQIAKNISIFQKKPEKN